MINVSVNNETMTLAKATPLSAALMSWGYTEGKVAVAINGEFVARSQYPERELIAGDKIDIVKPVGGG